jgi:hypothetical protein
MTTHNNEPTRKDVENFVYKEMPGVESVGWGRVDSFVDGIMELLREQHDYAVSLSKKELHSNKNLDRKKLVDFLKYGTLTDGSVNPNTLNTLERYIQSQIEEAKQQIADWAHEELHGCDRFELEGSFKPVCKWCGETKFSHTHDLWRLLSHLKASKKGLKDEKFDVSDYLSKFGADL